MANKITLIKTLSGTFKPACNFDYELAKKIKPNEPIIYTFSRPRNYKFHKKFFALINLVYENQEVYNNREHMRKDLTVCAGFYDLRHDLNGLEIQEPKSISFASMDEIEFSEFYNRIIDEVVKWLKFDKEELINEIEQYF